MELHTLKPALGAIKATKRIGRGQGSGKGGTSTKGHKGAQSRAGYKTKKGFEGGQNPIQRRLPKFGTQKPTSKPYTPINLGTIQDLVERTKVERIDQATLLTARVIHKGERYKILGVGTLAHKVDIVAHAFSTAAKKVIEEQGGTTQIL